jgi:CRP-like cAMP-binding protein
MADLRSLKDKAADLAGRGKLDKAAETYREVLKADPRDVAVRQRLAEVLRRAGRLEDAVEEYAAAAEAYARQGLLAKAIAVCKAILELDPAHGATQALLAELYARRSRSEAPVQRTGARPAAVMPAAAVAAPEDPPTPPSIVLAPPPEVPLSSAETPLAQIVAAAQAAVTAGVEEDVVLDLDLDEDALELAPPSAGAEPASDASLPTDVALPRVPIFSDLTRDAFIALTEGMLLRRVLAGDAVVEEGERGASFYVVASGALTVTKRDERGDRVKLARLGEGEFFGEMAILSGAPRRATVTAETDAELLELRAEVLLDLARRHPHLATSVQRFYRQRLLANAMAVSPVFRPFSRDDRRAVMARFRSREVAAGEVVIQEGRLSDGLYVVLDGGLRVTRWRAGGGLVEVAELREADVFGELSCLRKTPATATVTARRPSTLLRLPREGFDELVLSHPQVLEAIAELAEEREEGLDAILTGRAQWTEEGLVLI